MGADTSMMLLVYSYLLLILMTGGTALWKGATYVGIAGIIGPIMCWFAGSAFKGSLTVGIVGKRVAGFAGALLFAAVGIGLVYQSGFSLELLGHKVPGALWCMIGLVIGWISTKQQDATSAAR